MNIQSTILYAFIISVFFSCVDQKKVADTFGLTLNLKKSEATGYYQQGDYTDAVAILEGLVQYPQLIQYKRERVSIYYDLACNHALMGNKERALTYLQTAVEYGFANVSHLERDGDLELIRNDRRFLKLIAQIKRQQNLWENPLLKTPFRTNISEHEKIAGLSKLWSEIKYNFINFDLVPEVNLDSLYMEYLKKNQGNVQHIGILQAAAKFLCPP